MYEYILCVLKHNHSQISSTSARAINYDSISTGWPLTTPV